jgi:protein SCO1/2
LIEDGVMKINGYLPVFGLLMVLTLLAFAGGAQAEEPRYKRSEENCVVPDVTLIDQDRQMVRLVDLLNADKPVLVDFIYGTCTTICPILSAGFSSLQRKLAAGPDKALLVSISIDPEYDTPEVMTDYLKKYQAKPGWLFLTGTRGDINKVMRAFDAYVPNKMEHYPITFLRGPGEDHWVRIHGLVGTSDLMKEYRRILGK